MSEQAYFKTRLKDGRSIVFRSNGRNFTPGDGSPIHTRINGFPATDEDIWCALIRLNIGKEDFMGVRKEADGSLNYIIDRMYYVTEKGKEAVKQWER